MLTDTVKALSSERKKVTKMLEMVEQIAHQCTLQLNRLQKLEEKLKCPECNQPYLSTTDCKCKAG